MLPLIFSVCDEHLVEGVLPDDVAQGGLCDLIDCGADVFDDDDGLAGIDDAEVGNRGDVDTHVVAGDDPLRLDRHGHDAHRNPH